MAGKLSIASSLLLTSRVGLIGRMRLNVADKKSVNVRLKLYQYLVRVVSLKSWFIRISWYNKCDFVMDLVSITQDFSVILKLVKNIDSGIFKDYSYLKSQDIVEGFRDMIPADDNRTLEDVNLEDVRLQDKLWYARLKPDQQYHVLSGLTTIGGCAFKRKIYERIVKLITVKQKYQSLMHGCPSVNYSTIRQMGSSYSCGDTATPDEEWMKYFEQLKYYHRYVCEINQTGEGDSGEKRIDEMKGQTEIDLQKLYQLWRDEFQQLCTKYNVRITPMSDTGMAQLKGTKKPTLPAKKGGPQKTTFDEIQMLPETINSRIFSYLGKDAMNIAKNVNPYWTFMVNAVTKEQDTAKKVNERISKLEQCQQQQSQSSVNSEPSSVGLPDVPETPHRKGREEVIFLLKLFNRASRRMQLAPKPNVTPLNTEFLDKRVTACNREGTLLAVSTSRWSVIFYSLAAGSTVGYELVGHCDQITCMCFSSCGNLLITGSSDTTARCWDVSRQSALTMYSGHEGSVTSVTTGGDYVLTGGMDYLLKVFRRLDGQCLATLAVLHPVTCVELNIKEDLFYCGHKNGRISIFNFSAKNLNVMVTAHRNSVNVLYLQYPILVSGGSDGVVRLWNSKEPKCQCLIEIKNYSEIHDLCMAEYHIFTGDQSGHVCAWNLITGQKEQELTLGGIPSPVLSIHCKKRSNSIQVIANAATAVHSIEMHLWDVKNKPVFGPPHKKCCASFMAPSEKRREPFGLSSSAYKQIMLMKHCCVHKSLRDPLHEEAFFKSILAFVVNEVPSSFAMPAVSLKPFKRIFDLKETTLHFDEMYRRDFPLVILDSILKCT